MFTKKITKMVIKMILKSNGYDVSLITDEMFSKVWEINEKTSGDKKAIEEFLKPYVQKRGLD